MNAAQVLTWLVIGVAASLYLITRFYRAFFGECAACEAAKIKPRPKVDSPKAAPKVDSPKAAKDAPKDASSPNSPPSSPKAPEAPEAVEEGDD